VTSRVFYKTRKIISGRHGLRSFRWFLLARVGFRPSRRNCRGGILKLFKKRQFSTFWDVETPNNVERKTFKILVGVFL